MKNRRNLAADLVAVRTIPRYDEETINGLIGVLTSNGDVYSSMLNSQTLEVPEKALSFINKSETKLLEVRLR